MCWAQGDSLGSSGGPAGLLTLIAPLDFEALRAYYLSVEGSRGKQSLSDVTTVIVNVTDVNDNSPVFEDGGYSVEVMEDLPPGAAVMKVGARTPSAAVTSSSCGRCAARKEEELLLSLPGAEGAAPPLQEPCAARARLEKRCFELGLK